MPPATPEKVVLTTVPFFAQKRHQCGPASLAMVLNWAGDPVVPDQLVKTAYTPGREGSLQAGLVTAARRRGKLAYPVKGIACLIRELAAERPVIVLQNLGLSWLPRWHYAVAIGYDRVKQKVFLHSGEIAARRVGLKVFTHTWKRSGFWGLLVLPADQIPECAREPDYLKATLGLQLAGHPKAAAEAFQAAVNFWPRSSHARIALGNALYALGRTRAALEAFCEAVRLEPQNADALNNMAYLLAESGDLEKGVELAQRAVTIGGPRIHIYRKTLDDIRRQTLH